MFSALPLGLVLVVVALDPGKFLVSILIEALGATLLSDPTKFMSGIIFLTNVNLSPSSNETLADVIDALNAEPSASLPNS